MSVAPSFGTAVSKGTLMQIAIASGKGGTGKTIVATNLAATLGQDDHRVTYLDCDVEAPNGHIFLKPEIAHCETVSVPVPEVNETLCTCCGRCGEFCQYSAIVCLGNSVLTFPDLCHGCGGCKLVCPEGAIREIPRPIGEIEQGKAGPVDFVQGRLYIGQAIVVPLIRAVKRHLPRTGIVVLDAPPGNSCPVVETIRDADLVLLVAEPTPFGLHDLRLAVEMVRQARLPHVVVINRAGPGRADVGRYCDRAGIPILLEIPEDRRVAETYSRGELAIRAVPAYAGWMRALFEKMRHEALV
jgi:MinD superfamily P-loop ATPase